MVGVAGFEPATPTSRTWCATRLRYTPTEARSYIEGPAWPQAMKPSARKAPARTRQMSIEPMTRIINADQTAVEAAARCLAQGGLLAFPTETVYGLGADACNGQAIARLYEAKGRPAFNPLICHVPDRAAAGRLGDFDAAAARLGQALWPGPLTLVVPKRPHCGVAELATAVLKTTRWRVPNHPVAHAILNEFGRPVVAPSANRSGHISPTTAAHVMADLRGRIDLIVDGGATPVGVESTIVACLDRPVLLRPGGVPRI